MGCISGQIAVYRNFVPLLQGVLRPALPREPVRASRLTFPVHGVAVGIRDVHVKEYMRILPGDVRNHAFQGDWLRRIEFARKSVMRKSRHSGQKLHARYDGEEKTSGFKEASESWVNFDHRSDRTKGKASRSLSVEGGAR